MKKNAYIHIRTSKEQKDKLKAITDRLNYYGYDISESDIVREGTEKEIEYRKKEIKKMEKR